MLKQIKELENTSRIVHNLQNLVGDCSIKGNDAEAVAEIRGFLTAFVKNVDTALEEMRQELFKQADGKQESSKAVDAEVVSQPSQG